MVLMQGRKPKPTKLKLLHGDHPCRVNKNEPKPKPIASRCPTWLHPTAKKKWRELAPKLERLGLLTEIDGEALELLVTHYAIAVEAASILKKEGIFARDSRDLPAKHPAAQIFRDHSAAYRSYMTEFGLSPSSRSRLDLPKPDDDEEAWDW